jgi:hypothetical protein
MLALVMSRRGFARNRGLESFPICATAFIAESEIEQREQFILVNSTKPLPKGLIYELLPEIEAQLPTLLFDERRLVALRGGTFIFNGTLWCLALVWGASAMSRRLRGRQASGLWLKRATGAIFVGLGVRLAVSR